MKKIILLPLLAIFILNAQNSYINQILILNEGYLDFSSDSIIEPVTIGSYDISADIYSDVITIEGAKFASDLIIEGDFFYVAADNRVNKYDLNTYELISTSIIEGARKLAIYNDYLFVSKGDYDPLTFGPVLFDSYLDVYDLNLDYLFGFPTTNGPQFSTENIIIENNKLYILINNAYEWGNYQGIVGIINLNDMSYQDEISLGDDGKNPVNLMKKDGKLYTTNNKNWDGGSISVINTNTNDVQTLNLSDISFGCGVSVLRENKINYQESGGSDMKILNLETLAENGVEGNLNLNFYAVSENPINGNLYASTSDFVTNSSVIIYNENNFEINSFTSGVTTNKIVFDVRTENNSSISENYIGQNKSHRFDILGGLTNNSRGIQLNVTESGDITKSLIIKQ